jgi:UDP-N-acetylmuramoyl-tripeptide--D-alanyl-D-alanine ligase
MHALLTKPYNRLRDMLAWRAVAVRHFITLTAAKFWRNILKKPTFIAVTGSAGKSTTKELLQGMLSAKLHGKVNPSSFNQLFDVGRTILGARPTDDFCLMEMSANWPGYLDKPLALFQPTISIVTVVADDGLTAFRSREGVAKEKVKLIEALPENGIAILNVDDALVAAMASKCKGRVITYGLSEGTEIRAQDISAAWPDRLSMTIVRGNERILIRTQLCGTHWVPSVLAAIAAATAMGLTLQECADGIAKVEPFVARMQPVITADNVTFIRDDWKAPVWTLNSCFEFMQAARAKRKILVIGTLADYPGSATKEYARVARQVIDIADHVIFIGQWAAAALRVQVPGQRATLRAFSRVRDASDYVNSILQPGDLVLLKGTTKQDHLLRIILARSAPFLCWRDDCKINIYFCDVCPQRTVASGAAPTPVPVNMIPELSIREGNDNSGAVARQWQTIVGLGNPDAAFASTPHNVGYRSVEAIAALLNLTWESSDAAMIALGQWKDRNICLIKLKSPMNLSGAALKSVNEKYPVDPINSILVFDDLDLPLGTVRTRLRGSAGGHRGVASILDAFQSDTFRRVKIGVGRPGENVNTAEYVLTPFPEIDRDAVDKAIEGARERALALAAGQRV